MKKKKQLIYKIANYFISIIDDIRYEIDTHGWGRIIEKKKKRIYYCQFIAADFWIADRRFDIGSPKIQIEYHESTFAAWISYIVFIVLL